MLTIVARPDPIAKTALSPFERNVYFELAEKFGRRTTIALLENRPPEACLSCADGGPFRVGGAERTGGLNALLPILSRFFLQTDDEQPARGLPVWRECLR
jgi:hypothetical protein